MSGGYFNYQQGSIEEIADAIESELLDIELKQYSPETVASFVEAIATLRKAATYAYNIDWLLSGDIGEAAFTEGLTNDLSKVEEPTVEYIGMEHIYRVKFYGDDNLFINGVTDYLSLVGGKTKEEATINLCALLDGATGNDIDIWKNNILPDIKETIENSNDYENCSGGLLILIEYYRLS